MSEKKTVGVCYCGVARDYQEELCNCLLKYANESVNVRLLFFTSFVNDVTGSSQDVGMMRVFDLINWDKLDGMIILGQVMPDKPTMEKIIRAANENGVPCVCIDYITDLCPCVTYHCGETLRIMTDHLIKEHGCKKLNFITGIKGIEYADEREEGFKQALRDNGIEPEESRIKVGWWWHEPAGDCIKQWIDEGCEFDAVVCANDMMAIGAMAELKRQGLRVPEDVKVTGIDMLKEGINTSPQLTSADFDRYKDVEAAFDILFGKTQGSVNLHPDIYYSESCGCEKAHRSEINESLRMLEDANERIYRDNQKYYLLESKIIEQPNWNKALEIIREDSAEQWVKKLWLCVNSDLIRTKIDDLDKIQLGYNAQGGYTEYQRIIAFKNNHEMTYGQTVKTEDLIPGLDEELDECRALLVFPLHISDCSLGYGVREISNFWALEKWYIYSRAVSNALMIVRQENDLALSNKMLEEMYNRDSMTRLYNRRGFFKNLNSLEQAPGANRFIVISVDLDGLKYINDNFGHLEGDNALIIIAGVLSELCGKDLICARFGGDEFIAAGFADKERGAQFELDLQSKLSRYNEISQKPYKISASTGRTEKEISEDADFDNMVMLADEIMYRCKSEKKARLFRGAPRND